MENLKTLYSNLTSVNIEEQKLLWDERGKGYYGEFLVFSSLYKNVDGLSKFLMNLNIPTNNEKTTEIDLMMLHETGIYVFEIKHYKGTIYGQSDDEIWTQYFRTVQNSTFKNPIKQNEYHISALKKLFPEFPIYSVIVFSNEECDIKINNKNNELIVTNIYNLANELNRFILTKNTVFDVDKIDSLFCELSQYSPIRETSVDIGDVDAVPFYDYIGNLIEDYKSSKSNMDAKSTELTKQKKKSKISLILLTIIIAICASVIAVTGSTEYKKLCDEKVDEALSRLHEMENNFEKVDLTDNNNRILAEGMLTITTDLKVSEDLANTVVLDFSIKNNAKEYGIILNKNSKLLVTLSNGDVKEYDVFKNEIRLSGTDDKTWYASEKGFTDIEIFGIESVDEIAYIKITKVTVWNYKTNQQTYPVQEIEVYSK